MDGEGTSNVNANWSGVMGGVITGQFDMSLSAWLYQEKGSRVLSFSNFMSGGLFLVATPKVPSIDFSFFYRDHS